MHRKQCWYFSAFLSLSLFAFAYAFVSIFLSCLVGIVMSVKTLGPDYAEALKEGGGHQLCLTSLSGLALALFNPNPNPNPNPKPNLTLTLTLTLNLNLAALGLALA